MGLHPRAVAGPLDGPQARVPERGGYPRRWAGVGVRGDRRGLPTQAAARRDRARATEKRRASFSYALPVVVSTFLQRTRGERYHDRSRHRHRRPLAAFGVLPEIALRTLAGLRVVFAPRPSTATKGSIALRFRAPRTSPLPADRAWLTGHGDLSPSASGWSTGRTRPRCSARAVRRRRAQALRERPPAAAWSRPTRRHNLGHVGRVGELQLRGRLRHL